MSNVVQKRYDPLHYLKEECILHVFSFLAGVPPQKKCEEAQVSAGDLRANKVVMTAQDNGVEEPPDNCSSTPMEVEGEQDKGQDDDEIPRFPGPFWDVKEAGHFYVSKALVSRGWKDFLDLSIGKIFKGTPPLNLDWDQVSEELAARCVDWLCRSKLSIGRVRWICDSRDPRLQHFYCSHLIRLLHECNTLYLSCVDITIHLHFASPTYRRRASSKLYCQRQMQRQRTLQNLIASNCPNLMGLGLQFVAVGDEDSSNFAEIISPALLSLPSVRYMAIVLTLRRINHGGVFSHGQFFNNLIKNMTNLNVLYLGCTSNFCSLEDTEYVVRIESKSLLDLNVERFDQGASLHMTCPRLKRLSLRAGYNNKVQQGRYRHDNNSNLWEVCFHQRIVQAENTPSSCFVRITDASSSLLPTAMPVPCVHMMLEQIVGEASVHIDAGPLPPIRHSSS